jgi:PKD repeat protein
MSAMHRLSASACLSLLLAVGCGTESKKEAREPSSGLVLEESSKEHLVGRRGRVRFEVRAEGSKGARASFQLAATSPSSGADASAPKAASRAGAATLEVTVRDEQHGELRFQGTTLDGDGALSADEERALRELFESALYAEVPLIGLDTACATDVLEPRLMAALLFPWQATLKYLTPDRAAYTRELANASSCHYFTQLDGEPDGRGAPTLPLLANAQAVPRAFGYLPFDDEGELGADGEEIKALITPDVNVFGPGQSLCRGACGADCEPNNCGEPKETFRCVQENGRNTGEKERWKVYTCGEHEGCIEHDACFDDCNGSFGVGSWDAAFCMRGCDLQAAAKHGAVQGLEWATGEGPFTREKSYEYATGERLRDEEMCPLALGLTVVPSSGVAPLAATIAWNFDVNEAADERCRLDLGDGSAPVTIDPCPARGEYAHEFAVPSELRNESGVYTVTLTRIGANQTATTDVQASWRFFASPTTGTAPLSTRLGWDGLRGVEKPLTCTLSFGDDSEPVEVENCATHPGVSHDYTEPGAYTVTLTVRGEDRPVTKTLVIDVDEKDEEPIHCAHVLDVSQWTARASFSYSGSASDGWESIEHTVSTTLEGTLTVVSQGGVGIGFSDNQPSGEAMLVETHHLDGELLVHREGAGAPLPEGSQILLNIDLADCTFNVHVQASVAGKSKWGDDSPPEDDEYWMGSFNSEWRPLSEDLTASFEGTYPAHSESFIFDSAELDAAYCVEDYSLIQIAGEDALGTAHVSWEFAPVM